MEQQNWNLTENPFSPETEDEETIITSQPSSASSASASAREFCNEYY